ncbi:MAG: hypothetical protein H6704_30805 [Myxococcales bacterium]|nr:hypothetical protein [Myxococcales bacterium]
MAWPLASALAAGLVASPASLAQPTDDDAARAEAARLDEALLVVQSASGAVRAALLRRDRVEARARQRLDGALCASLAAAGRRVDAAWGRLAEVHAQLAALSTRWPARQQRAAEAQLVVAQQRRLDAEHHAAWAAHCAGLPPTARPASPPPPVAAPLCDGLVRYGPLLVVPEAPPRGGHGALPLVRRLSARLEDAWDVLLLLAEPGVTADEADRASIVIERGIPGLGAPAPLASAHLPRWRALRAAVVLDGAAGLRRGPSLRALLRADGGRVRPPDCGEAPPAGWGYADVAGQLGGATLEPLDDGRWRPRAPHGGAPGWIGNGGNRAPYAPLELYLMGLVGPEAVGPVRFLGGVEALPDGTLRAEKVCTLDGAALVARYGRRPLADGPLRLGVAVVGVGAGDTATLERHRRALAAFAAPGPDDDALLLNDFEATGGRARLRVVPPRARPGCRPTAPVPTVTP